MDMHYVCQRSETKKQRVSQAHVKTEIGTILNKELHEKHDLQKSTTSRKMSKNFVGRSGYSFSTGDSQFHTGNDWRPESTWDQRSRFLPQAAFRAPRTRYSRQPCVHVRKTGTRVCVSLPATTMTLFALNFYSAKMTPIARSCFMK